MLSKVKSIALQGLEGDAVLVEVDVSKGLPAFDLVGLPDAAVREARERVRAAIKNSGYEFPVKRITVNLAPADIKKEGAVYDLAIAVGILAATGQCNFDNLDQCLFLGELSLDGTVRPVNGILPSCIVAKETLAAPVYILMSPDNIDEGALVKDVKVIPVANLRSAVDFLEGRNPLLPHTVSIQELLLKKILYDEDFSEVFGHAGVKRALEVAAAGGHNVLLIGPPGSGKTMLARRFTGILPSMSEEEALEVTQIYSVAGLLKPGQPLITKRPFRAPHHNASASSLVGGGRIPKPGEISLAHRGVLFLDELPEFSSNVLESLRQPMEDGKITISRVNATLTYPAKTVLLGAMNPCPCGYYGDIERECNCSPAQIKRYLSRISGPLLDRIDIHVEVPRLKYDHLTDNECQETTAAIVSRVSAARSIQAERFNSKTKNNAAMTAKEVRKYCKQSKAAAELMKDAFYSLGLSARAYNKILKISRTIADLEASETIEKEHLAEAIDYRSLDRNYWG
ncbi:MAG: YifB family Mg chelatase-like AAA ATPase [Bacillota bacterium]